MSRSSVQSDQNSEIVAGEQQRHWELSLQRADEQGDENTEVKPSLALCRRSNDALLKRPPGVYGDTVFLAAYACNTPVAALVVFRGERQQTLAGLGLSFLDMTMGAAFCAQAVLAPRELTVVPDVRRDPNFCDRVAPAGPNLRFYAGAPLITSAGVLLGVLYVAAPEPQELTPEQQVMLRSVARQACALLELRRQQTELKCANALLAQQSATDVLTGLANRRAFEMRLGAEQVIAERSGTALSVLIIDVDRFKRYNDTFGHPAGDHVLRQLAGLLGANVRRADMVARYGGEEFVVVVPSSEMADALLLAERCREAVAVASWDHSEVTVSIGVASSRPGQQNTDMLVQRADQALYDAKRRGGNQVASYRSASTSIS